MASNDKRNLFVSFCVKMLQTLSTETESSGYKIVRVVYNILNAFSGKSLEDTTPMSTVFKTAATPVLTSAGDSGLFGKIRNLFSKSSIGVDEAQTVGSQGDAFKMMREDIQRYISFTKDVMLLLFSSSGGLHPATFVSVVPMFICILLSSLSGKRTGVMDPMTQIERIVEIAKLGATENIRVKLGRLTTAQRQIQSAIPADSTTRPPDLIGDMIASVKKDVDSSSTSSLSTSGLDIKIGTMGTLMRLVK